MPAGVYRALHHFGALSVADGLQSATRETGNGCCNAALGSTAVYGWLIGSVRVNCGMLNLIPSSTPG